MKSTLFVCLTAIMSLAIASNSGIEPAVARGAFDGTWAVVISTDSGGCDTGQRLSVEIRDGALLYSGAASVELQGRVNNAGLVQVRVANGGQSANGTGRLSATAGNGTWRGAGSSGACAGRWSAERI
jgi:hypothetical protein